MFSKLIAMVSPPRVDPQDERRILDTVERFVARRLPPAEVRRRDAAAIPPYDLLPEMGARTVCARRNRSVRRPRRAVDDNRPGVGPPRLRCVHGCLNLQPCRRLRHRNRASERQRRTEGGAPAWPHGGPVFCALALTEPGASTDAGAITTRAECVPGGWRLTDRKSWIGDARGARYLITPARTEPGATGAQGITLFLVPREAPGIAMTPLDKIGNHAMPSWDIGFDGVEIDADAVLGEVGRGFQALMRTLHISRASMAATVTGCAQAALDLAIAHAGERVQFGRPLSGFQVLRHRLADLQMRVDAARLMVEHLAGRITHGEPCRREAAQAKIMATEALQDVTNHGMQLMASAGYAAGADMNRYWRDARLYTFGEGANEALRDLVAREMGLEPGRTGR